MWSFSDKKNWNCWTLRCPSGKLLVFYAFFKKRSHASWIWWAQKKVLNQIATVLNEIRMSLQKLGNLDNEKCFWYERNKLIFPYIGWGDNHGQTLEYFKDVFKKRCNQDYYRDYYKFLHKILPTNWYSLYHISQDQNSIHPFLLGDPSVECYNYWQNLAIIRVFWEKRIIEKYCRDSLKII